MTTRDDILLYQVLSSVSYFLSLLSVLSSFFIRHHQEEEEEEEEKDKIAILALNVSMYSKSIFISISIISFSVNYMSVV